MKWIVLKLSHILVPYISQKERTVSWTLIEKLISVKFSHILFEKINLTYNRSLIESTNGRKCEYRDERFIVLTILDNGMTFANLASETKFLKKWENFTFDLYDSKMYNQVIKWRQNHFLCCHPVEQYSIIYSTVTQK